LYDSKQASKPLPQLFKTADIDYWVVLKEHKKLHKDLGYIHTADFKESEVHKLSLLRRYKACFTLKF
jgi:hypothetical protein